jgi:ATP-dependent HslUV protease subunit HslV
MRRRSRSTTVVAVKRDAKTAIAGDGQVTLDQAVLKRKTRKVLRVYHDKMIVGFAGSAADGLTLLERFEAAVEKTHGNLPMAAREFAKEWRTDRILRRLEALLIVADKDRMFVVSGAGDIVEPDDGIAAIGSGGGYALAAARALIAHTELGAEEIAREALRIAAGICVYTNDEIVLETIE